MTIPILLSESIPREIAHVLDSLAIGMPARYNGITGTIQHVSDAYIGVCCETECMLVTVDDWDNLEIDDTHFYWKNNPKHRFSALQHDHPGNEMLPPMDKR